MDWFLIYLRGLVMGAADVVPGVSGGTIAFITGIYDRLLLALSSLSKEGWKVLFKEGIKTFWVRQDMTFLVLLGLGVVTSIGLLSHVIKYLLYQHPEALWSFFFGLIISSGVLMIKAIDRWRLVESVFLLLGIACSAWLSLQVPAQVSPSFLKIFLAGAVAICAMVLPGISGSFILLLLGFYGTVITAIQQLDLGILSSFLAGCFIGLFAFVHLVNYFLTHYKAKTFMFLLGLMLGSLIKVWPWKETLSTRLNSHGEAVPLLQKNIWPAEYQALMPESTGLMACLGLMVLGALLLGGMEALLKPRVSRNGPVSQI